MAEATPSNREPSPAPAPTTPEPTAAQPTPAPAPVTDPNPAPAAAAQSWPDDWRIRTVGELPPNATKEQREAHTKELKRLERMTDPTAVWKSYRAMEAKVSSGELKSTTEFPKDGTDAEKAAWREQNGVPKEPAEYLKAIQLPKGVEITDDEKPMVDKILSRVHEANGSPQIANTAVALMKELKADAEAATLAMDETHREEVEETLRQEWPGPDYQKNRTYINNFMSAFPPEVQDAMKNARMPDGRALFNSPEVLRTMARLQRELNPIATVLPNGANGPKALDARLEEIRHIMRTDRARYNKDETMRAEYRELLNAQASMKSRAA